jgi:hypothetical protein
LDRISRRGSRRSWIWLLRLERAGLGQTSTSEKGYCLIDAQFRNPFSTTSSPARIPSTSRWLHASNHLALNSSGALTDIFVVKRSGQIVRGGRLLRETFKVEELDDRERIEARDASKRRIERGFIPQNVFRLIFACSK